MPEIGEPRLATMQRMQRAEEKLLELGMTQRRARRELAEEWGMSNRQVGRIIRRVFDAWRIEGRLNREDKRNAMRQRIQYVQRRALSRKAALFNPADGCVEYYENPDSGAAIRGMELECRLDGLLEQDGGANIFVGDEAVREAIAAAYGIEVPTEVQAVVRAPKKLVEGEGDGA